MGRRDSSPKVKSSKRKRDNKKKKSRKKDRKKRRIGDSVDDLLNSGPTSFPTLKSHHTKRINKKNRLYSDYESLSSDSDSYKSRKDKITRKKLDRDGIVKPIKKTSKKKFSKYSSNSDTESHSICQSSGSSADALRQRSKVIPKRDRERRGSQKGKKIHKERTPSCSSFDTDIEPSISIRNSDKALFPTNNSRRLRSVIVVVDHSRDEMDNRWEMAPHKQEILHDQNDYPCPKSNENENLAVEEVGKSGVDTGDLGNHELERAQTDDSGGAILESMLRHKALERLRKFQQSGPRNTTVKKNNESDVGTVGTDQNKLIKEGSSNTQERNKVTVLSSEPEFSLTQDENKKVPDSAHFDKDPGMAKQSSEEDKIVDTYSSTMEPSSSIGPLERGNEAKDGSQFQQKTMSVMRGGEQVQVSYKVYIPKKAPAFARRQLRR